MQITSPTGEQEVFLDNTVSSPFAFTANSEGPHKICLLNNAGNFRRVLLEFKAGVDARDYAEIAKKEHLKPLEVNCTLRTYIVVR